jgi:hypothetical protein
VSYDANPRYPIVGGAVEAGYGSLAGEVARTKPAVLAIDGPAAFSWQTFIAIFSEALSAAGVRSRTVDARDFFVPWAEVRRRTASASLPGDPVFGRLFDGTLDSLVDRIPEDVRARGADVTVVFGPGSALLRHDLLWYADLPKRLGLAAVQAGAAVNVGQPQGSAGSEQRLFFVDWPMLDRHKRALADRLDRYIDLTDPDTPRALEGGALRRSLAALARRPFRVRPSFLPGPWGGQWLRRVLGVSTDAPNLAWSYELITPESGLLLGSEQLVEVGFELLMAANAEEILGREVAERFGHEFPIRFDYLDTLEGGHLSLQVHPREDYAREVFGLPYTQLESYYVMVTTPGSKIFLGLRENVDLGRFRADAERAERPGQPFDPERYVQAFPAEQRTRAVRETSCSRSARRPTSTPCASTIGSAGASTTGSGRFMLSTRSRTSTRAVAEPRCGATSSLNPESSGPTRDLPSSVWADIQTSSSSCIGSISRTRSPTTPRAASTSST